MCKCMTDFLYCSLQLLFLSWNLSFFGLYGTSRWERQWAFWLNLQLRSLKLERWTPARMHKWVWVLTAYLCLLCTSLLRRSLMHDFYIYSHSCHNCIPVCSVRISFSWWLMLVTVRQLKDSRQDFIRERLLLNQLGFCWPATRPLALLSHLQLTVSVVSMNLCVLCILIWFDKISFLS